MPLPALDRGLLIVEKVLFAPRPLRYGELKDAVAGIGDASLNRLLKALSESGCIARGADGRYVRGSRLERWRTELGSRVGIDTFIEAEVTALSHATHESVAYGRLERDAIRVVYSISCPDSISVLPPGGVLHFEADHAGALAVLAQLDTRKREAAVQSSRSAIGTIAELDRALANSLKGAVYLDRSRARVGVSRLSAAIHDPLGPSTLFYCLPTERMLAREEELTRELVRTVGAIERRLTEAESVDI